MSDRKHEITFSRKGNVVNVNVYTDLPFDETTYCHYPFVFTGTDTADAELLLRYLERRHAEALAALRLAEWLAGWKAAKAKKRGKANRAFYRGLRPESTCYRENPK